MQLTAYDEAEKFLEKTQEYLEQDEVTNSLTLGLALRLKTTVAGFKASTYLASVEDETGLVLTALMTPPFKLVLASNRSQWSDALEPVALNLYENRWPVPAVIAPSNLSKAFAEAWVRVSGQPWRDGVRQRAYKLTEVIPPKLPSGRFRIATEDDAELVAQWVIAFDEEALHGESGNPEQLRASAVGRVRYGEFYLWEAENGRTVSIAARARPSRHGETVNAVYTPPEERGKGYASACVAALSQLLLDSGRRFVTLFTDLSNPTSNSIYQKIGYRPVCDFNEYVFG